MELFLEGLFACFNHSESLRHSKGIFCARLPRQNERTFTKGKEALDTDENDFENTLCLEIKIINVMSVIMPVLGWKLGGNANWINSSNWTFTSVSSHMWDGKKK